MLMRYWSGVGEKGRIDKTRTWMGTLYDTCGSSAGARKHGVAEENSFRTAKFFLKKVVSLQPAKQSLVLSNCVLLLKNVI